MYGAGKAGSAETADRLGHKTGVNLTFERDRYPKPTCPVRDGDDQDPRSLKRTPEILG